MRDRNGMWIVAAFVALSSAALAEQAKDVAHPPKPTVPTVTTVILVRHAEKNTHIPGGDAGLSAKGQLRARELVRALGDTHLDAIYSTSFGRARMTAEPVARDQHDSVTVYDPEHLEKLAEQILREQRGRVVLVVGHSDTLPQTYEALTGERFPDGESIPYDKLYIVVVHPTTSGPRLLTLRYGQPAS